MLYDTAVIIPTVLRPHLKRAVHSVYKQDFKGTVQILVGIDVAQGPRTILDELRAECPPRMTLSVVDPGFSTSRRHKGYYSIWGGGALRSMMSYAANSRFLAYLDDDNWWGPRHLSDLRKAIARHDWAYSLRWYVDPVSLKPICVDRWESVGPGKGIYAKLYKYGGHVDTNCLMIDKRRCHWALPAWCLPHTHKGQRPGGGEDRVMFQLLSSKFRGAATGRATAFYLVNKEWRRVLRFLLKPDTAVPAGNPQAARMKKLAARIARAGVEYKDN
jgi:hypothetical protein